MYIYIYIYVYISIYLYVYLSIYVCIHPSIHPSIYFYLSIYLSLPLDSSCDHAMDDFPSLLNLNNPAQPAREQNKKKPNCRTNPCDNSSRVPTNAFVSSSVQAKIILDLNFSFFTGLGFDLSSLAFTAAYSTFWSHSIHLYIPTTSNVSTVSLFKPDDYSYWKCNFPMTPSGPSVGWLGGH